MPLHVCAHVPGPTQELHGLTGGQSLGSSDPDGPGGFDDDLDDIRGQPSSQAASGSDLSD